MKVGMIFECVDEGADMMVCLHLARRIRPDVHIEPDPQGNKRNLLESCGESAAQLFEIGCEKVIVIWDLYPSFKRDADPCRHNDKELIYESLIMAGVSSNNVELICIEAELETWLVADYRAVRDVIQQWAPKADIGRLKRALESNDPKDILDSLFRKHAKRPYQPHVHAEEIVKAMPNLSRLNRVESFQRFKRKLTN